MRISVLFDYLGNHPIHILTSKKPDADIRLLLPLDEADGQACQTDQVLYYGPAGLLNMPESDLPENLLLYGDRASVLPALSSCTNVLLVDKEELLPEILSFLSSGLAEDRRLAEANENALQMLIRDQPIQEILNTLSEAFEHYMVIQDNALNIPVVSTVRQPPNPENMTAHARGYILPEVLRYLKRKGTLTHMRASGEPVYVADEPWNTYCYTTAIYLKRELIIGFLTVHVKKGESLSPLHLYHLRKSADLLSLYMSRNNSIRTGKATYFTRLLTDMLENKPVIDGVSYRERFAMFQYQLHEYKRVCVIHTQNRITAVSGVESLASELQYLLPNAVYTVYRNDLVFLISANSPSSLQISDNASVFLQHNLLHIGISPVFTDEALMQKCYEAAGSALSLGERRDPGVFYYYYEEYAVYDIMEILSGVRDLELFCFLPLLRLYHADRQEGKNELMNTLLAYLHFSQSVQQTCKALFIHRNTLYYRLQKIREIMGCDFTAGETIMMIELTVRILETLHLYQIPDFSRI